MTFPATQWTLLAKATVSGDQEGRAALNELCTKYWDPVFAFTLAVGWGREDAEDLSQQFFVYVMDRGLIHQADRDRGTFRAFLKTVLRRFLSDEVDRRKALKRGGGAAHLPLDSPDVDVSEESNLELEFDRNWARTTMDIALAGVMDECVARRGEETSSVLRPMLGGEGQVLKYEAAAEQMGLSLAAFKSEVREWRLRLRDSLRAEVLRTVSAPHELDREFSYLRELLAG